MAGLAPSAGVFMPISFGVFPVPKIIAQGVSSGKSRIQVLGWGSGPRIPVPDRLREAFRSSNLNLYIARVKRAGGLRGREWLIR